MIKKLKIPIRFKILIAVLVMISLVVSIITVIMSNMFHTDKTTYIRDMTSSIAIHKAKEADSFLKGYLERMQIFVNLIYENDLYQEQKSKLIKQLFEEFREFVAITVHTQDKKPITVFDAKSLERAGLTIDDISRYRKDNPFPKDHVRGGNVFIENSSLKSSFKTLTLVTLYRDTGSDDVTIIEAVISLVNLVDLAERSKVFETFIVDSRGNFLVHSDPQRIYPQTVADRIPEIGSILDQGSLGGTFEYVQNDVELIGGFAQLDSGDMIVGVQIRKSAAYLTARELLKSLMIVALILLIISAIVGILWSRKLTKPIERLSRAAKDIGQGIFDITIEGSGSGDEIGDLAHSFNQMTYELDTRAKALQEAQGALVQSEKMAAFGQLGAGIAHEVKNPLAGILGFAQLSLRKVEKDNPLHKNLMVIEKETKRCKTIIENLLKFARQEKVAYMPINLNNVVEESISIVEHQMNLNNVKLEKNLQEEIPEIQGNGNQIQQVLMNLMINAQQAMDGNPGVVRLDTTLIDSNYIEMRVSDNGPGMTDEVKAKIFEPFFTTKAAGKGTGLGLSVSYGIIKDHGGDIFIESAPGEGTVFVMTIPVNGRENENNDTDVTEMSQR